jgi:uncharacterized protein (TIGR02246 family)
MDATTHADNPDPTAAHDATAHDGPDPRVEAVRRVVTDAQRLQNDVDGFTGLLTDDVAIVNFGGRRVQGRGAVRAAMEQALASPLADVTTTQEVHDVRFPRSDVAVVDCVKFVHDARDPATTEGEPPLRDRGMLTFVLVEQPAGWRIAVAQTTPVAA